VVLRLKQQAKSHVLAIVKSLILLIEQELLDQSLIVDESGARIREG
jgi:hypothetical protein